MLTAWREKNEHNTRSEPRTTPHLLWGCYVLLRFGQGERHPCGLLDRSTRELFSNNCWSVLIEIKVTGNPNCQSSRTRSGTPSLRSCLISQLPRNAESTNMKL